MRRARACGRRHQASLSVLGRSNLAKVTPDQMTDPSFTGRPWGNERDHRRIQRLLGRQGRAE